MWTHPLLQRDIMMLLWGMTNLGGVPGDKGELLYWTRSMTYGVRVVTNTHTYAASKRDWISSPKPQSWSKESPFDLSLCLGQVYLLPAVLPAAQKAAVLLLEPGKVFSIFLFPSSDSWHLTCWIIVLPIPRMDLKQPEKKCSLYSRPYHLFRAIITSFEINLKIFLTYSLNPRSFCPGVPLLGVSILRISERQSP